MDKLVFDSADNLLRIVISAPILYFLVILYIRIIGKRTTSQMNSFDWIVTVAMGSLFASTIILKDISLIEGAVLILILIGLQFFLTKLIVHSSQLRKIIRSTPQLLVYNGCFLENNMASERIVENEVLSAIRHRGIQNIDEVHAVVLETDATFSVIKKVEDNASYTLADVQGLPEGLKEELEKREETKD